MCPRAYWNKGNLAIQIHVANRGGKLPLDHEWVLAWRNSYVGEDIKVAFGIAQSKWLIHDYPLGVAILYGGRTHRSATGMGAELCSHS